MALPPIILAAEEPIRLLSPWDDAIDTDACLDVYRRYVAAGSDPAAPTTDLDAAALALRPGVAPTWFVVRALSPREVRVVQGLQGAAPEGVDWAVYLEWAVSVYLRFGLVSVEGWEGWDAARRVDEYGLRPWARSVIDALPAGLLHWLGYAVYKLSTLDVKKNARSGSSRTAPGGTDAARTSDTDAPAGAPSTAAAVPTPSAAGPEGSAGASAPQVPQGSSPSSPAATC